MGFNFPNSPADGTSFTPAGGPTYTFSNGVWKIVGSGSAFLVSSDAAPVNPFPGQLWFESDSGALFFWYVDANSSQWVQVNFTPSGMNTAETRNRIVNPAMQISQENGTTAVNTSLAYPIDQWMLQFNGVVCTAQKSAATAHQLALSTVTGVAVSGNNYFQLVQPIEGIRMWDSGWGAAGAVPLVLRFEAYANVLPGTYGINCRNAAAARSYVVPFTITATGVWQTFSLPIPADTAGTWPIDNTVWGSVGFIFACGPGLQTAPGVWTAGNFVAPTGITNGAATAGNNFYIRNVGLHLDPLATGVPPAWTMPDEAQELAACQRYWERVMTGFSGNATTGSNYYGPAQFTVPKRTVPSLSGVVASGVIGFPNTVGTLNVLAQVLAPPGLGVQEVRVCNVTGPSTYNSLVTGNARM
jgi:hypothetical protein